MQEQKNNIQRFFGHFFKLPPFSTASELSNSGVVENSILQRSEKWHWIREFATQTQDKKMHNIFGHFFKPLSFSTASELSNSGVVENAILQRSEKWHWIREFATQTQDKKMHTIFGHFFKLILIIAFISLTQELSAMGIGACVNSTVEFGMNSTAKKCSSAFGASFSLKPERFPFYLFLDTSADPFSHFFTVRAAADYWILNPPISDYMHFFFGVGALCGANMYSKDVDLVLAPRVLFGLNWILFDGFLEPFLQITAQPAFALDFADNACNFLMEIPIAIGVRIWN